MKLMYMTRILCKMTMVIMFLLSTPAWEWLYITFANIYNVLVMVFFKSLFGH